MVQLPSSEPSLDALRTRLDQVMIADRERLVRRIDRARGKGTGKGRGVSVAALEREIEGAEQRIEQRRLGLPVIRYPPELPVSQRREELAEAIDANPVVIVAGETGSGKTTQLPKICLELGRGVRGMIGHTQPRRLAARTVAERICDELATPVGGAVGYAVRFTDRVGDTTLVKVMTDGILLTDIDRDRSLSAYDTLIIDEAHERSLNIDFILGYLAQLMPARPDLKVIVTSATIDPERFAAHFGGAPIVEVSGRTYPVETRYRPQSEPVGAPSLSLSRAGALTDQTQAICDAVTELGREPPGDILVFLSGEREIRDAAEGIRAMRLTDTEVLPLYARLSTAEQHRVFESHSGRRIVLATNVAETSLTVPGVRYVIDPGTARISRYSHRLKVQRLPIEPVSQASADQRAGRCGRVAAGVCIRLYAEDDYDARPAFTEPEILRTNLASVILQMTALGLGDIAAFPFLDPPDRRAVADGIRLLDELGALESATAAEEGPRRLTPVGRRMARLPVDPRFARMVIEADRTGCLREVLIITAGLSIEDPRERPAERAGTADELHARFADGSSDFLAYLHLWRYARERQRALSSNQFRRLCREELLHHLRLREWQDVHSQLRQVAGELGMRQGTTPAEPDVVHRALLAGLLSHVGVRDGDSREFRGARNSRFMVFPGSSLSKRPPQWVMAAELVETSRLWARTVARIQPEWAESLAPHLVKRSYSEPHWSTTRGSAMAYETVTLYGLPIVTRRLVGFGRIDPEYARELFIAHALVDGDWRTHHRFVADNRELTDRVEALELRFRRNDLLRDDALYRLYDERIPASVVSARHFDSWWKKERRAHPEVLTFTPDMLLRDDLGDLDESDFPETWQTGGLTFDVTYEVRPGEARDGATVHVPLSLLNQVAATAFDWPVPGFREARVVALIRSLPKELRRNLVPVPEHARAVLERVAPGSEPLIDALSRELSAMGGVPIPRDAWDVDRVPEHLHVHVSVEDVGGEVLADGRDIVALQRLLAGEVRDAVTSAGREIERSGLREWSFGDLAREVRLDRDGVTMVAYPGLVDEGDTVAIRVFDSEAQRDDAMWAGLRRLVRLGVSAKARVLRQQLDTDAGVALRANPYTSVGALMDDCIVAALDSLMIDGGAPVWDADAFGSLRSVVAAELPQRAAQVVGLVAPIIAALDQLDRRLVVDVAPPLRAARDDIVGQRQALLHPGFVSSYGIDRLEPVLRYVQAMVHRLDAMARNPGRDRERMAQVQVLEREYGTLVDSADRRGISDVDLERIGWMIEELRVSLFAQHLGTDGPVSEKRIRTAMSALA